MKTNSVNDSLTPFFWDIEDERGSIACVVCGRYAEFVVEWHNTLRAHLGNNVVCSACLETAQCKPHREGSPLWKLVYPL